MKKTFSTCGRGASGAFGGGADALFVPGKPLASVTGAGAAGGGGGGDAQDNAGGGIGGAVIPAGTYVVHGDRVRWVPAVNANLVIVCALVALRLVLRHRRRTRR